MNATPADQLRLLDLADLDERARHADADRQSPPQAARVSELLSKRQELSRVLSDSLNSRDDLRADLRRIESDVAMVDARRVRDDERLRTVTSPKDAAGLEHELASLARRKSELEDAELEVMEKLEQADADILAQETVVAEINDEGARLSAEGKGVVADATARLEAARRDRTAIAAGLPADLVAAYDRCAKRSAGAALLRRGTCEGCHMMIAGTDMAVIRSTSPEAVVNCPECGCILVRTDESGL